QAFASVARKGVAVTPYGITRVTTGDGTELYKHQDDTSRVLVAPWVAAGMTDLLQTAVATGTGKNAQIGRPVAGKTGTTSANKDGWFLGFSSGITTGVWMGRDDNRAVGGLQGGRAPANAFSDFMKVAVADRPIENFETSVTLPEWQLEPDDEAYGSPDNGMEVDADGNPVGGGEAQQPAEGDDGAYPGGEKEPEEGQRIDQKWIDSVLGRR
ncbi:MAG: penicillin-binding transpeptidase domain-containing protein, partial [Sphingobium sp.]